MKTPKEKKTIETRERAEVKDFKAAISEAFSAPQEQLCLIYAGKILKVHPYMFGPCRIGRQKSRNTTTVLYPLTRTMDLKLNFDLNLTC